MNNPPQLDQWHHIVFEHDLTALHAILAEEVVFHSPFVWQPYHGREATFLILSTVMEIFVDFAYHRELINGDQWVLEFSARIGNRSLKGIDLIRWNEAGQMIEFEVFIRPFNALQALGQEMQQRLAAKGFT